MSSFCTKAHTKKYKSTVPVLVVLGPKGCFSKGYNFVNQWRKINKTTCYARLHASGWSPPSLSSSPLPQRTGGTLSLSKSNLRLGAPSCRALTFGGGARVAVVISGSSELKVWGRQAAEGDRFQNYLGLTYVRGTNLTNE